LLCVLQLNLLDSRLVWVSGNLALQLANQLLKLNRFDLVHEFAYADSMLSDPVRRHLGQHRVSRRRENCDDPHVCSQAPGKQSFITCPLPAQFL